jgi:imidazolonepropionase-like amidohydrolase
MAGLITRSAVALTLAGVLAGGASLAAGAKPAATSAPIAIVGATVFDATGAAPHLATVVIAGGRIVDVGPKAAIPRGATVIQAKGEALLPGFFDVHTHWTPGGVPRTTPQIANAYISSGVTTTDDFNAAPESFEPRRRWLATLAAPHVNLTARMGVPGGHGADWADTNTIKWFSTPESARAALREVLPYKPDLVKGFQDGWRYGSGADNNSMDLVTLSALVDEAHKNHLKVLTHTVTLAKGKEASQAKVDVIAHSLQDAEIDQAMIDLMKANGTAYAPTLAVYEPVKPGAKPRTDDTGLKASMVRFNHALHNVKRLHDAGILVALGTDAGMPGTPHGTSTLHEMELLVQAGLTPTEALMAGTANSAKAIGEDDDRGTIEKGKRADLVLVKGTPWTTIGDVRKTDRVFVDGKLVFGPGAVVPAANAATSMPPIAVPAKIDDFERADGRSDLDTLVTDNVDGGPDRSVQVTTLIDRENGGGHALNVAAKMSQKAKPNAGVIIPLTRGSIQPADLRAFHGVRFDIRAGAGAYGLSLNTADGRWTSEVAAGSAWRTVEAPFSALKFFGRRGAGAAAWTGDDLVELEVTGAAPAGQKLWMQIDNVSFY